MTFQQILRFLLMGANIHHISWDKTQTVHSIYGYVSTQDGRVFTMEEFLRTFSNPYYQDGWCFSDPFEEMAERTVNDSEDRLAIHEMARTFRDIFCKELCGEQYPVYPETETISRFWHGTVGMYRVVDEQGTDYLLNHCYSEEAIGGFVKKLVALGIVKNPSLLCAVPL